MRSRGLNAHPVAGQGSDFHRQSLAQVSQFCVGVIDKKGSKMLSPWKTVTHCDLSPRLRPSSKATSRGRRESTFSMHLTQALESAENGLMASTRTRLNLTCWLPPDASLEHRPIAIAFGQQSAIRLLVFHTQTPAH